MLPEAPYNSSDDSPHSISHTHCFTALHLLSAFWSPPHKHSDMQIALLEPGGAAIEQLSLLCAHRRIQASRTSGEDQDIRVEYGSLQPAALDCNAFASIPHLDHDSTVLSQPKACREQNRLKDSCSTTTVHSSP